MQIGVEHHNRITENVNRILGREKVGGFFLQIDLRKVYKHVRNHMSVSRKSIVTLRIYYRKLSCKGRIVATSGGSSLTPSLDVKQPSMKSRKVCGKSLGMS